MGVEVAVDILPAAEALAENCRWRLLWGGGVRGRTPGESEKREGEQRMKAAVCSCCCSHSCVRAHLRRESRSCGSSHCSGGTAGACGGVWTAIITAVASRGLAEAAAVDTAQACNDLTFKIETDLSYVSQVSRTNKAGGAPKLSRTCCTQSSRLASRPLPLRHGAPPPLLPLRQRRPSLRAAASSPSSLDSSAASCAARRPARQRHQRRQSRPPHTRRSPPYEPARVS